MSAHTLLESGGALALLALLGKEALRLLAQRRNGPHNQQRQNPNPTTQMPVFEVILAEMNRHYTLLSEIAANTRVLLDRDRPDRR